jgi:hypothetical protein
MKNHNGKREDDEKDEAAFELTASEKKAMEKLPRDLVPTRWLEDRVVRALRERGFLKPHRSRVVELTGWRIAVAAAACVVLLAIGFVFGQRTGSGQPTSADLYLQERNDLSVATSLQHAGSAYLLALERLTTIPDSADGQQAVQGREVALTTLCTAADQVTRLVPKNELAEQLLDAIESGPTKQKVEGRGDVTIEYNRIIEF